MSELGSTYAGFDGRKLPHEVITLLLDHGGWLVGSACPWFTGHSDSAPGDYDVIVPPHRWCEAMRFLASSSYTVNALGGLKFTSGEDTIDVWPDDLMGYFRMGGVKDPVFALSLQPRVLIQRTPL